jgi:hypothetical protein
MEKSNLELLKNFDKVADSLKDKVMPYSYWEKEDEFLKQRIEENRKMSESISMSLEKYHQPYI